MAMVQLEKLMFVNPFGNRIVVDKAPENIEKFNTKEISEKVNSVFEEYKKNDEMDLSFNPRNYLSHLRLEVLSPSEIDLFLQLIIKETNKEKLEERAGGPFISKLIQKSYDAGNNNFYLTTNDCMIDSLCCGLKGKRENPITIIVSGNADDYIGSNSCWSIFEISGGIGAMFAFKSKNSVYILNNILVMNGKINSSDCSYRTKKAETYDILCEYVSKTNYVCLIDDDMKIMQERPRQ